MNTGLKTFLAATLSFFCSASGPAMAGAAEAAADFTAAAGSLRRRWRRIAAAAADLTAADVSAAAAMAAVSAAAYRGGESSGGGGDDYRGGGESRRRISRRHELVGGRPHAFVQLSQRRRVAAQLHARLAVELQRPIRLGRARQQHERPNFTPNSGRGVYPGAGPHPAGPARPPSGPGPHPNWYHGNWHDHWNHPWYNYPAAWWAAGFVTGAALSRRPRPGPGATGPTTTPTARPRWSSATRRSTTRSRSCWRSPAGGSDATGAAAGGPAGRPPTRRRNCSTRPAPPLSRATTPPRWPSATRPSPSSPTTSRCTSSAGWRCSPCIATRKPPARSMPCCRSAPAGIGRRSASLYPDIDVYTEQLRALEQYVNAHRERARREVPAGVPVLDLRAYRRGRGAVQGGGGTESQGPVVGPTPGSADDDGSARASRRPARRPSRSRPRRWPANGRPTVPTGPPSR